MASASFSSTCVSKRELLFFSPKRRSSLSIETKMFDIFSLCPSFRNYCAPRMELLLFGMTPHRLSIVKQKVLEFGWKDYNQITRKWNFDEWSFEKGKTHLMKAVATVEPEVLVPSFQFNSDSETRELQSSHDESSEMDEKEKLRRMKISLANKGNVPWNKGRRHSPETLQRIRERTKIAMQDPKVKMKLVNLGHAQSEETRIKIGVGVREGWQRRREMLMVQESCLFEWQNFISEASRKGYAGDDELQWDSYEILDEQLKQEWLESVEKRKLMPRPKGSKRAPKSPEQRRKISEAISAKWADPEYRGRVCSALAKYHGVPIGVERKRQRRPPSETSYEERESMKRIPVQSKGSDDEAKSTKKVTPKRKKRNTPSYKDPMSSSKFEMIRKIRAERAAMENKKKEAIERAKLLIAEAEKAAKALEVAALKSPLARASLLETRKLISEATRSIESIESGQLTSHELQDEASDIDERIANGSHSIPSQQKVYEGFDFDRVALDNALKAGELSPSTRNMEDLEVVPGYPPSPSVEPDNDNKISGGKDLQLGQPMAKINGYSKLPIVREEEGTDKCKEGEKTTTTTTTSATKTKKWVCGRLVEVDD